MALELSLSYLQYNDATALVLTDDTGNTESGDWGQGGNINIDDIDNVDYGLELDITVTTSDGSSITYDSIDLYDVFGPFSTYPDDMVFTITADMLVSGGTAMGASGDKLDDGVYEITYTAYDLLPSKTVIDDQLIESILVDGQVRIKVFDQLREISTLYDCTDEDKPLYSAEFQEILDSLLKYGLFSGMLASVSNATQEEVLNILDTLKRLTVND